MCPQAKVVHLTSVHDALDVRILHKECGSLARAGYDVVLVAPHCHDEVIDSVQIRAVPKPPNRLLRLFRTDWQVFRAAIREAPSVIHLHDPELIPAGLLMRAMGKRVIYDVHEDYVSSIRQKQYLPKALRFLLPGVLGRLEVAASRCFRVIIAERYYTGRFPHGLPVMNYPLRSAERLATTAVGERIHGSRVLYTGVVARDRGALLYAEIAARAHDIEVFVVGLCSPELAAEMRGIAGTGSQRLHIEGEGTYVPHQRIEEYYTNMRWTAGLAIFPPTPHYMQKELTKLFEYMAAGIPVICSDFPVWRRIIEDNGVGICVDPLDPEATIAAIRFLARNPKDAERMGRHGQELVRTCYNWDGEAAKLLALYRELTK